MTPGLISIITPVFNRADLLVETVESVLKQSYRNWQLIIVDDNSNHETIEVIENLRRRDWRLHLHVKSENDVKGPACSRNLGVHRAEGEFVVYLDSDDLLFPHCLEQRID